MEGRKCKSTLAGHCFQLLDIQTQGSTHASSCEVKSGTIFAAHTLHASSIGLDRTTLMVQRENTYKYTDSWNSSDNMPINGMWTGETRFSKVGTGSSFLTVTSVTDVIDVQYPPFIRRRCCGCARHVNTYRCSHYTHNTCSQCAVELPIGPIPNGVDYP
eukprot:39800-Amphidinium_carterae.1